MDNVKEWQALNKLFLKCNNPRNTANNSRVHSYIKEKFEVIDMNINKDEVQIMDLDDFWPAYELWSNERGFPVLNIENVEEVMVCRREGTMIYSCFVWNTNSKMCIIGFPLGNPLVEKDFRRGGLTSLFEGMEKLLKQRGYTKIWTTSGTCAVIQSLEEREFINADPNVNVYIKML